MEMGNSRRLFERSREPGMVKKPRLAEESDRGPNPNGNTFTHRAAASVTASASRFRNSDRVIDNSDLGHGAYHPQPPQQNHELVSQYKTALAELILNSKPIITNLTIIAGENLHVAKAVANVICANIIEVPSEQKLPSLYLLDSIVKNIGRDYIKYFAIRLPEVFCKAYKQVDPSVHQSMRHLFGTWKGVFPPQTLQMIEKELGFTPIINGSSTGAATSRSDSQSDRPPHSIHVNPKYLERQRLQQPDRAKGVDDDVAVASSGEDAERPVKTSRVNAGRSWVDVKSIQRYRDAPSDPRQAKNVATSYGEYDSGGNSLLESGRVTEQGRGSPWFGGKSSGPDAISASKNGFSIKRGLPNYSTTHPVKADVHLQTTKSLARGSSSGMSSSWKNSEEEEFMWDIHTRLSPHDSANITSNSRTDWTTEKSEKSELDNHLQKPRVANAAESRMDRETSIDSLSSEYKDQYAYGNWGSSWSLQESRSPDGPVRTGASVNNLGHSEGYSSAFSGLHTSASSSLGRKEIRPPIGSSYIGSSGFDMLTNSASRTPGSMAHQRFQSLGSASPSRQSPMHKRSPSPTVLADHPQLVEQGNNKSHSLLQTDPKISLFSRQSINHSSDDSLQNMPSSTQVSNIPKELPVSSGPNHYYPFAASSTLKNTSGIAANSSGGLSSTSSLLASVMQSGIFSKSSLNTIPDESIQELRPPTSVSSTQQPLLDMLAPTLLMSSGLTGVSIPLEVHDSHDKISASTNISHRKVEKPLSGAGLPLPPLPDVTSAQTSGVESKPSDPISKLLSSLVSKGLISASNPKSPSQSPPENPTHLLNQRPGSSPDSSMPVSLVSLPLDIPLTTTVSDIPFEECPATGALKSPQPGTMEVENLIGLQFRPEVIREFHQSVISSLFDGLPLKCSLCGLHLKLKEQLDRHLEWHASQKLKQQGVARQSMRWYANSDYWATGKLFSMMSEPPAGSLDDSECTMEGGEQLVPADETQSACVLCGELFEDYFSQRTDQWMFKGAVFLIIPSRDADVGATSSTLVEGPIVHAHCVTESSVLDLGIQSAVKVEKDV